MAYAQVAAHPALHRQRSQNRRTLVVLDEIHHVGVYATSVSTALFFAQAAGRFVRARRRGETASAFLPPVPVLLSHAAELEAERDHVLRPPGEAPEEDLLAQAQRERGTPGEPAFQALGASAHFDRVLYDGGEFGTATAAGSPGSPEEEDFLGLPGLLDPGPGPHPAAQAPGRPASRPLPSNPTHLHYPGNPSRRALVSRRALAALREEPNGLVGAWSHRTGQPHGAIHAEFRRACGGPPLPQATADEIQTRIDTIRRWALTAR